MVYQYKHYNSEGFVGLLNVSSEFALDREINTAGSQLEIEITKSFNDASPTALSDNLIDENANYVVDNNGNNIISSVAYVLTGIPNVGDRVDAIEFNDYYPEGVTRFSGLVSRWNYDDTKQVFIVTLLNYGVQLDNKIIEILPNTAVTGNLNNGSYSELQAGGYIGYGQSFQVDSDISIKSIRVWTRYSTNVFNPTSYFGVSGQVTMVLKSGALDGTSSLITSTRRLVTITEEETAHEFEFSSPVSLTAATTYSFYLYYYDDGAMPYNFYIVNDSSGTYTNGTGYAYSGPSFTWSAQSYDLKFQAISATGVVGNVFNSYDPAQIIRESLDTFQSGGGLVRYTSASIEDTNTTVSYTFRFNTYKDLVQKCVELAPSNYYWFIDPADNTLYFKSKATSPDHTLVKGTHFTEINIEYSLEQVKNLVYFSGGDDGSGSNLMDSLSNSESVSRYGTWLETISDSRVTTQESADILMQSVLTEKSSPQFIVSLLLPSNKYDSNLLQLGQIVVIKNQSNLFDNLSLQIHKLHYTKDYTALTLGQLVPTQSKRLEDIKRNLRLLETKDNPDSLI